MIAPCSYGVLAIGLESLELLSAAAAVQIQGVCTKAKLTAILYKLHTSMQVFFYINIVYRISEPERDVLTWVCVHFHVSSSVFNAYHSPHLAQLQHPRSRVGLYRLLMLLIIRYGRSTWLFICSQLEI